MHSSPNDASHQGNSAPLKRAMSTRHLVMISLGGAIGTGLFLGSGEVIAQTGPVGAIIAYFLGGIIAYMVMLCLGELAVHMPESGSFGAYAETLYWTGYRLYHHMAILANWSLRWEPNLSSRLLMQEWFPDISMWLWTLIFGAFVFSLNMISTKWFAESEFWLALVKVSHRCCFYCYWVYWLFLVCLGYQGDQAAPRFTNLTAQGWFPEGLFPIFATMLIVNFAFSGTELIGVAAGETEDPGKMSLKPLILQFSAY